MVVVRNDSRVEVDHDAFRWSGVFRDEIRWMAVFDNHPNVLVRVCDECFHHIPVREIYYQTFLTKTCIPEGPLVLLGDRMDLSCICHVLDLQIPVGNPPTLQSENHAGIHRSVASAFDPQLFAKYQVGVRGVALFRNWDQRVASCTRAFLAPSCEFVTCISAVLYVMLGLRYHTRIRDILTPAHQNSFS